MQPLSASLRRFYLYSFIALFLAILPVLIFYANGWRYQREYGFVRTGGIYLSVPYPDANVYMNGELVGRSGFIERSFYTSDLAPSAYIVHVEREGYHAWDRLLVVEEQLVTDSRALLIPLEIPVTRLLAATSTPGQFASTTRVVSVSRYESYIDAFATSTVASSTIPLDESDGIGLFLEKGKLVARWIDEDAFPPSLFCERPSICASEIDLASNVHTSARFFRGGIVYATRDGKVYFTELDIRNAPTSALLQSGKAADLRIVDDMLLSKIGTTIFEIEL